MRKTELILEALEVLVELYAMVYPLLFIELYIHCCP